MENDIEVPIEKTTDDRKNKFDDFIG